MFNKNFCCGDTHGIPSHTSKKLNSTIWPEQKKLTKGDNLFVLGDFGWIFYEEETDKEQEYWLKWLAQKKYTLIVVPGNHENYDVIEKLPIIDKWGAKVRVLERSYGIIYFLERGYVYTINGKTFFAMGGAQSSERPDNQKKEPTMYGGWSSYGSPKTKEIVEGINWWSRELPSKSEYDRAIKSLDAVNWVVDYVITHTCPSSVVKLIATKDKKHRENDPLSIWFEKKILDKLTFKEWFFGHFHVDMTVEYKNKVFSCFYMEKPYEID